MKLTTVKNKLSRPRFTPRIVKREITQIKPALEDEDDWFDDDDKPTKKGGGENAPDDDQDWPDDWLDEPEPKPKKKARKRMPNGNARPHVAVRLSPKTLATIDKLAAKEMKRRSDVLRELIDKALRG